MTFKRILNRALLPVLLLFCLAALPAAVSAADAIPAERTETTPGRINYDVKVTVRVTEDADGWNDAWIAINQKYESGTARMTETKKITGLKGDFDDKTEFSCEEKGLQFPTSVDVYTDFGGGASWRRFQADVTVYVNGVNVASKHISVSSSVFSSSDATNTVTIDGSKYPYPVKAYIYGVPETVQLENGSYSTEVRASMLDQYGSSWDSFNGTLRDDLGNDLGSMSPVTRFNTVNGENVKFVGYWTLLRVNEQSDRRITYTYDISTANTEHPNVNASFAVQYKCPHKVEIVFGGTVRDTVTGVADDELALDYPDLIADGFDLEWSLEGGGLLDPGGEKYYFGTTDGVLTATQVPYSFTVVFDGNGATKGSMASRIQRVGTTYTLPGNTYTNTGYEFVGWNTLPDGTGDAYPNKGAVQNLSTVKGDTVTLYAQWRIKTYTVTFVNKMTGERTKQTVEYGQDAVAPEIPPLSADENEHYVLSGWNKTFSGIKSNITVTSVQVKEAHTFVDEDGGRCCSVCGYREAAAPEEPEEPETQTDPEAPEATASIIGNGGPLVIAILVALMAAAAAAAVIVKKRKTRNQTERDESE